MIINYEVSPTFAKVHRDKNRHKYIRGPVGSGKSIGCVMDIFHNALKQHPDRNGVRKSRYLVVRATYPALKSTVIRSWIEWFKDKITITYSTPILGKINYPLDDGTRIEMEVLFMAVDDVQAAEKLRSLEVTGAHINEASEIDPYVYEIVNTRINRYPSMSNGGAVDPFIISDYNSVSTDHWLYTLAEERKPEGYSFYAQPPAVLLLDSGKYIVNPEAENLKFLPPNYYEAQIAGSSTEFINVNLMNNYGEVRSGKPVYKDYDDGSHCSGEPVRPLLGVPVYVGIDGGLTPAAVLTQQAPDGRVLVFDEITTDNTSMQEFCNDYLWPMLTSKYPEIVSNVHLICDPACAQRSATDAKAVYDILRECGFKVKLARTNNPIERREAVIHYLRQKGYFKLSRDCRVLRKGFINGYKYDLTKIGFKETPVKNAYSHPHDALQYAMMEYHHAMRKGDRYKKWLNSEKKTTYQAASSIGGY